MRKNVELKFKSKQNQMKICNDETPIKHIDDVSEMVMRAFFSYQSHRDRPSYK